jgi:hypothetical protein
MGVVPSSEVGHGHYVLGVLGTAGLSLIWAKVQDRGLVDKLHAFVLTIAPFIGGTWLVRDGLMSWVREAG